MGGAAGAVVAAPDHVTTGVAAASERGYAGCSCGLARMEVISVAWVGEAVACWLLEKQEAEDQYHRKRIPSKRSRTFGLPQFFLGAGE